MSIMKFFLDARCVLPIVLFSSVCSLTSEAYAEIVTVDVIDLTISFDPRDVTINVGDSIMWTNLQPTHNVAQTDSATDDDWNGTGFLSGNVGAVDTYTFKFTSPGLYYYVCEPHAIVDMKGTVTVEAVVDIERPVAVCQDIVVNIGAGGTVTITGADVDGGSTDNIGIESRTVAPDTFSCADLGDNQVDLTVSDAAGNSDSCMATVTVQDPSNFCDTIPPVAVCRDIFVNIGIGGTVTITGSDVDDGSTDNIGIESRTVAPDTFSCADLGENQVDLTVSDAAGNSDTCMATVTVQNPNNYCETIPPVAVCKDIFVNIGAGGMVTIVGADVDGGSTDDVGIESMTVTPNIFRCFNLGENQVDLTVSDAAGNSDTCAAMVTVQNPNNFCTRPTFCEDMTSGIIAGQLSQVNIGSTVVEGLPVEASIALIEFHLCTSNENSPLADATENAYQINKDIIDILVADGGSAYLSNLREAVAILMTISGEVQLVTLDKLDDAFGINVAEPFEIVTESLGTYMPATSLGKTLQEEYLVFSDELDATRTASEPFSGSADLDNDGMTNAEEYESIVINGDGSLDDFVRAASVVETSVTEPVEQTEDHGGGGGCFIATAAYGTPFGNEIEDLRAFRDGQLLTNTMGLAFTDTYYRISPPLADFIARHPWAMRFARTVLLFVMYLTRLNELHWASYTKVALLMCIAYAVTRKFHRNDQEGNESAQG